MSIMDALEYEKDSDVPTVASLTKTGEALKLASSPTAIEARITDKMAEMRQKWTHDGSYLGTADAERRYELDLRQREDGGLSLDFRMWDHARTKALEAAEQRLAATHNLPAETNRQTAALESLEFQTRFSGRTLAEVVAFYTATPDDANPTALRLIEHDLPALRLREDRDTDLSATRAPREAIAARHLTREPKAVRDEVEQIRKLNTATMSALVAYAKSGTLKVAMAPYAKAERA